MIDLSVVVPLYDEEACVRESLTALLATLDASGLAYELIVVNNGSRDGTAAILADVAAQHPHLSVLTLAENAGYGGAILAGFAKARGRVLGFTCGDGEVAADDVLRGYALLAEAGVQLVKGKRIDRVDGTVRQLLSFGYHLAVAAVLRTHVTDVNGYPVLLTRDAYTRIRPEARDWMINVDLILGTRRERLRMAEYDVQHRPRLGGRSHVRAWFPVLFLWQLVRFRRAAAARQSRSVLR
jgi:glycosyltransferase involved in cell wall biosynthesis